MKKITRDGGPVYQGDLLIVPCDEIPKGLTPLRPNGGQLIVAHSETGHHHVIAARAARAYVATAMLSYLQVTRNAQLRHLRPHDTHETLQFPPGNYKMIRQREGAPEGWRRVMD